ncbi:MAG: 16S rRNA (cytosine(967)-C(5))-methyltransferase RsmB [Bacteroidota bacterium]
MTAREDAVRRLQRIEAEGAYTALVESSAGALSERDARFVTELVSGVTRWRRWLDYLISQFYRGDSAQLDPVVRQILRIGIYELLIIANAPHAAVHEAVNLTRRLGYSRAAGLVNAMLRNITRSRDDLPEPATGDRSRDLSIRYSHPTWITRRWLRQFGEDETRDLLSWSNRRPRYGVRVNLRKIAIDDFLVQLDALGVQWSRSPYLDEFVRIESLQPLVRGGLLREGMCVVQDEGAGLVVRVLDPDPGESVMDACAAPGGKALYAAERMDDRGLLLAVDVNESRLRLVSSAAERLGLTSVNISFGDARQMADLAAGKVFDRILIDAPCSGLGVLNKRADLRWRRTADHLRELVVLQRQLLDAAITAVKPGGLVVYSTCSIDPEENEHQVESFLERHPDFQLDSARGLIADELVAEEGYYRSIPSRHGIDGAFAARMIRR